MSLQPDGTYKTESRLSFIATRWADCLPGTRLISNSRFEDNKRVFCEGQNDVLEFYKEGPVRSDNRLQVCILKALTLLNSLPTLRFFTPL